MGGNSGRLFFPFHLHDHQLTSRLGDSVWNLDKLPAAGAGSYLLLINDKNFTQLVWLWKSFISLIIYKAPSQAAPGLLTISTSWELFLSVAPVLLHYSTVQYWSTGHSHTTTILGYYTSSGFHFYYIFGSQLSVSKFDLQLCEAHRVLSLCSDWSVWKQNCANLVNY